MYLLIVSLRLDICSLQHVTGFTAVIQFGLRTPDSYNGFTAVIQFGLRTPDSYSKQYPVFTSVFTWPSLMALL